MTSQPAKPVELFFSYSHKDEELRKELETHLAMLRNEGVIRGWHDRQIAPGQEWDGEIDEHLNSADIILLLASPDFLASKYCYGIEVARAMDRHEAGEACVIPVIVRPCEWQRAPFSKLQALPTGTVPVTRWPDCDEAFLSVTEGIRRAIEELLSSREGQRETSDETSPRSTQSLIPHPPFFGFVARRDANGRDIVGRLKEELAPGRNRSATLSGPGGIGKTTLAAETARELQEAYRNLIVWSSAEGRTDFALSALLDDIATQLGHAELRTLAPAARDEQVRALVAEAPALVVLDNYETVAGEEKKRIEAWFRTAHCSALFTSRHKIDETVLVQVSAMSREEAEEFLNNIIANTQDAQIFTADARRRIYETAEANPFVMQWVVGQIDEAQAPDEVLEELSKGEGDAAARVFDRSFNILDDDGRDTLLALSLFAPSATRAALVEVAGFDEGRVKDALRNLNRLWLVKALNEHRRFAVEGLTRSMAAARLSKDPRAGELRHRFVAYFLRYAVEREEWTPENYDALEDEKDNLLGAAETAFASEDWGSVMGMAYALAPPVDGMLSVRGYWDEATRLGEQGLQSARSAEDEIWIAGLSHNLAVMYQDRGELTDARRLYDESLEINRRLGNQSGVAITLHQLAMLAQDTGELEEARRLYDESLEINRRLGDQRGVANTLHNLAVLAQNTGELKEARRLYDESLEINRRLGNQSGVAITLHQLAMLAQDTGELEEARRLYDESLEIEKRLGNQSGVASTLHQLGRLAQDAGELEEARRLYDESLEINRRLGNQSGVAITLHQLAMLAQYAGELEEASRLYDESLEIEKRLGNQSGIANTLHQLAVLAQYAGELEEASRLYDESLEIEKRLGNQSGIAITLHQLAMLAQDTGELEEARRLYDESLEIEKRLGDQRGIATTLHQLAMLAQYAGELEEASRLYDESLEIEKRLGNQSGIANTLHQLGSLAEKEGHKAEAARLFRESLSIFERLRSPNAEVARRSLAMVEGETS